MNLNNKNIKPLFKYIGGKTWLKEKLREKVSIILKDNKIDTYVEPFAGGLGAFLGVYDILYSNEIKKVILSDINTPLIHLYKIISKDKDHLIEKVLCLEKKFLESINGIRKENGKLTKEELLEAEIVFKSVRKDFNQNKNILNVEQSARLVFLQKHAFNGVYRENSKGEYNTPFNWNHSNMINTIEERINELHSVLNLFEIQFNNSSYEKLEYTKNSLFYLDPPYANEDLAENKYNQIHFDKNEQLKLISKINSVNFIYSNHYVDFLLDKLKEIKSIKIELISRKNTISSSAETRKNAKNELLAFNKLD